MSTQYFCGLNARVCTDSSGSRSFVFRSTDVKALGTCGILDKIADTCTLPCGTRIRVKRRRRHVVFTAHQGN